MTFWVAGAAIVGSIGGAIIGSNASSDAVDAQTASAAQGNATTLQAQREAQAFQQKQLDQARADNAPWLAAGTTALNKLSSAPDFTSASVATDPGYQFGLSEGMKGVTNSAAARGGLLSGAALKAASQYNTNYATTKFDDAFNRDATNKNRLATLAGVGQTAAGQTANAGIQTGSMVGAGINSAGQSVAQNQLGVGNARASGYLAQGNALTGALNQGVSAWNQYNKPPTYGDIGSSAYYTNNDYLTS